MPTAKLRACLWDKSRLEKPESEDSFALSILLFRPIMPSEGVEHRNLRPRPLCFYRVWLQRSNGTP